MGGSYSQEDYDMYALKCYEAILQSAPEIFPDVGIDESLLKYSGPDSNAALQDYSKVLNTVPGYIASFGSAIAALNSVPNAVGIGALVISMIIEIAIKASTQPSDDTYSLLRRVFGEEKASSVRDTMTEYLKRHEMYMNNDQQLRVEIKRLEHQLSNHLSSLRNSLLKDGQMNSRGFNIWVNGAAFHVQMLIHGARLDIQAGRPASDYVHAIEAAINVYLRFLDHLLEKYKTYMTNLYIFSLIDIIGNPIVFKMNIGNCPCHDPEFKTAFMNLVFSKYEPITGLKSYFLNIKNNLNSRIHERGLFTLPSAEA